MSKPTRRSSSSSSSPSSSPSSRSTASSSSSSKPKQGRSDADRERRAQLRLLAAVSAPSHHGIPMPATPGPTTTTTIELGARAEAIAIELLLDRGYEIVERNYRCKVGELDIVAIDGEVMVFVEVRSRASAEYGDAVESVTRNKQRKVTRTAEVYLQHRQPAYAEYRFDVVAINGDADVTLYQDAWRGGLLA